MKKLCMYFFILIVSASCWFDTIKSITNLTKNDPYPLYNSLYPYSYLLTRTKNFLKYLTNDDCPEFFSISVSPFHQKANRGRDYDKRVKALGDLEGRWHMLGMVYGPKPAVAPSLANVQLGKAKIVLFGNDLNPANDPDATVPTDVMLTDSNQQIGYFRVPLKYRKTGIRFEACVQPIENFGITVQAGFAEIKQTLTEFVDLTVEAVPYDGFTEGFISDLETVLMTPPQSIYTFTGQGLEVCDFRSSSPEDVRVFVWWRKVYDVNPCDCEWPHFLFTPFAQFETSIPTAKTQDRTKAFALPFGNDGHAAMGVTAGLHIDFTETVEIGFYGGITHFFSRTIDNFRLPNNIVQSGVFPFSTQVRRKPGRNVNYGFLFNAYRFIDKLSCAIEYAFISHGEDQISLTAPEPAFIPRQAECLSKFSVHILNTSLYYEISPNFILGFGVQWPLVERNVYRATTVLGTIQLVF